MKKHAAADPLTPRILREVVKLLGAIREEQGLSVGALALKAGMSRPGLLFIEAGKRSPSLGVCIALARALNISLGKVLLEAERRVHERR